MSRDLTKNFPPDFLERLEECLSIINLPYSKALAEKAGIHQSTLSKLFKGKNVDFVTKRKIQEVLSPINIDWLLTGEDPKYLKEEKQGRDQDLKQAVRDAVGEAFATDPRLRLIDANLIVVREKLESGYPVPTIELDKLSEFESTLLKLEIPPPDDELSQEELHRYDRNAGLLLRWARTDKAQKAFPDGVPDHALEQFCRQVAGFYGGGWIDDVTGVLKDFIEEKPKGIEIRKH